MDQYLPSLTPAIKNWLKLGLVVLVVVALLRIIGELRPVFTPLLAAMALAYILNPIVTWAERRRVRRLVAVVMLYVLFGGILLTGGVVLTGQVIGQATNLRDNFNSYVEKATVWMQDNDWIQRGAALWFNNHEAAMQPTSIPSTAPASSSAPSSSPADVALDNLKPIVRDYGMVVLNTAISFFNQTYTNAYNLVALGLLVPMYAFFFLWHFNHIVNAIRVHLPAAYRDTIVHIISTTDRAIANFFRGRLVVCLLIALITGIGWQMVGLQSGLLLGLLAGVLNLVPFMSILALPPALLLSYSQVPPGQSWILPVLLTSGVYFLAQATESFLLSPLIESQANGLHPITTVVALMIGAQVAGLLGMLLAIPLTSTLKTLSREFLLPGIRRMAGMEPAPTAPDPPADPKPATAATSTKAENATAS